MTVTFDAGGQTTGASVGQQQSASVTGLTIGASANLLVAVFATANYGNGQLTGPQPSGISITWNGVALTQRITAANSTNIARAEIWTLERPATGNHTLAASWTNAADGYLFCASFVVLPTPTLSSASNVGTGTAMSLSVPSTSGDIAIGVAHNDLAQTVASTGQNQLFLGNDQVGPVGVNYASSVGASVSLTATASSSSNWVYVGLDIGSIKWGFEEEPLARREPRRTMWHAKPESLREEYLFNPTQVVFKPWGFEEELQRAESRRQPWRSKILDPNEFIQNPTQTVFKPWGLEEEPLSRRVPRRVSWRSRPEPLSEEYLRNPTQTVFQPWGFDEEQHRLERRTPHRAPLSPDDVEGIGRSQLVGVSWGFEEEPQHQTMRRPGWRAFAQPLADEFLQNPTQTVFAQWGFDEEQHRQARRVPHRAPLVPDDLEGIGRSQLVGVSWGFDEEQHREQRRIFHRQPPLIPDDVETIGLLQLVGQPWGFEEDPQRAVSRRRLWRAFPQALSDEFLQNPTQVTFAAWGFDEERGRQRILRPPWRAAAPVLSDEYLRNPTQTAFAAWGFEEEQMRRHALQIRRLLQQDDPLPLIVAVPWGFEEESHRRAWQIFRRLAAQDEPPIQPRVIVGAWVEEEIHRRQRRIFRPLLQQEDPLGVPQLVGAAWGFEEEQRRRQAWQIHRLLQQDDPLPQIISVPWGFEEERQIGRSRALRAASASVDEVFLAVQAAAVYYEEEQRGPIIRSWRRSRLVDEFIPPPAPAAPIIELLWGFNDPPPRQIARRSTASQETDEFILVLPPITGPAELYVTAGRRLRLATAQERDRFTKTNRRVRIIVSPTRH